MALSCKTNLDGALEAVMSGKPPSELESMLQELPRHDREVLLCTACSIQEEIARNCVQHGNEISALLSASCQFYLNGKATCLLDLPVTVRFEISSAALREKMPGENWKSA